jgi:hypothetical protein
MRGSHQDLDAFQLLGETCEKGTMDPSSLGKRAGMDWGAHLVLNFRPGVFPLSSGLKLAEFGKGRMGIRLAPVWAMNHGKVLSPHIALRAQS